jgi:hypothetical protein
MNDLYEAHRGKTRTGQFLLTRPRLDKALAWSFLSAPALKTGY